MFSAKYIEMGRRFKLLFMADVLHHTPSSNFTNQACSGAHVSHAAELCDMKKLERSGAAISWIGTPELPCHAFEATRDAGIFIDSNALVGQETL